MPSDGKSSHCLWQGELKEGDVGTSVSSSDKTYSTVVLYCRSCELKHNIILIRFFFQQCILVGGSNEISSYLPTYNITNISILSTYSPSSSTLARSFGITCSSILTQTFRLTLCSMCPSRTPNFTAIN